MRRKGKGTPGNTARVCADVWILNEFKTACSHSPSLRPTDTNSWHSHKTWLQKFVTFQMALQEQMEALLFYLAKLSPSVLMSKCCQRSFIRCHQFVSWHWADTAILVGTRLACQWDLDRIWCCEIWKKSTFGSMHFQVSAEEAKATSTLAVF